MSATAFQPGEFVRSKQIGRKAGFVGRVTSAHLCGIDGWFYRVRCPDGLLWHRSASDLSKIENTSGQEAS